MKSKILSLLVSLLCVSAAYGYSVATIGVAKIVHLPKFQANINAKINNQFAPQISELRKAQQDLMQAAEDFQKNSATRGAEENQRQQAKLQQQTLQLRERQQRLSVEMQQAMNTAVVHLVQRIREMSSSIGDKKGYDLILDKQAVLYSKSEAHDITTTVLDSLAK